MKLHFMGIAGSGASAAAAIAAHHGFAVSGCDLDTQSPYLSSLAGIPVQSQHSADHLDGVEKLILSPAIESLDKANPEVLVARQKQIPVLTWEEFVGQELLKNKKVVAVTGTHGKTTTTAMVATILEKAGLDPTVIIGARIESWGSNYRIGKGNIFVIEADEYGDNFLNYSADIAVVTTIEMDHPEYYRDLDHLKDSYQQFVANMKDDSLLITSVGVRLENPKGQTDHLLAESFELKVIGDYNQMNATLAARVAQEVGVSDEVIRAGLREFPGASRRMELVAEVAGMMVFDDYGHHPTEIAKTTAALREKYPDKEIWLIFQPHMFTRTKYLFDDFVEVLKNCPVDQVILTDIWQSREPMDYEVNSQQLVDSVAKSHVRKMVKYTDIARYISLRRKTDSIAVFMGAGDIYKASRLLVADLKKTNE